MQKEDTEHDCEHQHALTQELTGPAAANGVVRIAAEKAQQQQKAGQMHHDNDNRHNNRQDQIGNHAKDRLISRSGIHAIS
jgi:hypothetical protein